MNKPINKIMISKVTWVALLMFLIVATGNIILKDWLFAERLNFVAFNAVYYSFMGLCIYLFANDIIKSAFSSSEGLRYKMLNRVYLIVFGFIPLIAVADLLLHKSLSVF